MELPSVTALREAAGISQSYASMIRTGERIPPRPMAIRIFRETGWKAKSLSGLTDEQIDMLEQVEPFERAA